jgi:hypothetical protein
MIGKLKSETAESYFFLAVTILNLIPVMVCRFFPTMDGAAHLYNSNIINELIFKSNSQFSAFFVINTIPVPNWTGHFILSFFNIFLPAFIAEKILILFYLIALPYSFRQMIRTIAPQGVLLSYFIFPFTYTFLFLLGFYNFLVALVFMLIALNYWIKNQHTLNSVKRIIIIFLLITITYFSHIIPFVALLFLAATHTLFASIFEHKINVSAVAKRLGILLIASALPLALFIYYYFSTHITTTIPSYNTTQELYNWLKRIIAFSPHIDELYTKIIFYLICSLLLFVLYHRINGLKKKSGNQSLKPKLINAVKYMFTYSDFWLIAAGIIFILYFIMPDSDGKAGYISIRLGLLFFLMLVVWLATQKIPKWLCLFSVTIMLYCQFSLNYSHYNVINELNKIAIHCNKASEHITPNSIVLPLNYSDNWMTGHFSNYLGIEKPMILLKNYEAGTGYFPVKWNETKIPNTLLGTVASKDLPCLRWESNKKNVSEEIDYVFVLGNITSPTDSCSIKARALITDNYQLIYENENCQLFEKKI